MAKVKPASKRKRGKAALALGAAGVSLTITGGASATAPATVPSQDDYGDLFWVKRKFLTSV